MSSVSREQIREMVARALQEVMTDDQSVRAAIASLSVQAETSVLPKEYVAPWTGQTYPAAHPSQFQFNVTEDTRPRSPADEKLEFTASQSCSIEKNKPCDHCGMCRSLGF